jgi:hypothetical protein
MFLFVRQYVTNFGVIRPRHNINKLCIGRVRMTRKFSGSSRTMVVTVHKPAISGRVLYECLLRVFPASAPTRQDSVRTSPRSLIALTHRVE